MKKLLVLAAALAVVLTVFSFPVVAMAAPTGPAPSAPAESAPAPSAPAESAPAEVEVNTSFIEPNYYPDYDAADDAADDVAPKTGDFSVLPQMLMAAAYVGTLAVACKRKK